jgi:hypothetical protein
MGLEPTTPCLQSQIGEDHYLGEPVSGAAQGLMVLSVGARSGPIMTGVNGTIVAQPTLRQSAGPVPLGRWM